MRWICTTGCSTAGNVEKGNVWSVITGVLTVLMPKCAFCWAAYMSVLSSVGLFTISYKPWFLTVTIILFLLTLVKLLYTAIRNRNFIAFIMAFTAGGLIVIQKLWYPVEVLNYVAVGMMIFAVWMKPVRKLYSWLFLAGRKSAAG